jgi:ribose transport system substrate-binding protein
MRIFEPRSIFLRAGAAVLFSAIFSGTSVAQEGSPGIVVPVVFPPYKPDAPACNPPPGLKKSLAFAQDNERQFISNVGRGLKMAATDRSLEFEIGLANNDGAKMIAQVDQWREAKVGAVVAAPVNPQSLSVSLQKMIWQGAYVGTVVPPPAISILNAPQYLTGKVLGDAAAAYIRQNFKQANVVLLTHDSLQFLAPRFVALRDALRDIPGTTIVADISPATVNKEGGAEMMRTILLANPKIDVVLGADTVVLGALDALRAAGKARSDQFLGGIDGEPEAVSEIKKGGPYKTTVTLASSVFGYAMGEQAADWLEGKSIPQAMDILPKVLTAENSDQYERDLADPAAVFRDAKRRDEYLKMYGNICYDTRDQYVNFAWSSERK